MRIIYNFPFLFPGVRSMTFFGIILTRESKLSEKVINHEAIHFAQMKDYFYVFYYPVYLYQCIRYGYRNCPFEKEAYDNDDNLDYLKTRKSK